MSLDAIRDAMDKSTNGGRDIDTARTLADEYVATNPSQYTELSTKTLDECVAAVDVFRAAGMTDEQWKVEAWLLHKFESQNIGAKAVPVMRVAS